MKNWNRSERTNAHAPLAKRILFNVHGQNMVVPATLTHPRNRVRYTECPISFTFPETLVVERCEETLDERVRYLSCIMRNSRYICRRLANQPFLSVCVRFHLARSGSRWDKLTRPLSSLVSSSVNIVVRVQCFKNDKKRNTGEHIWNEKATWKEVIGWIHRKVCSRQITFRADARRGGEIVQKFTHIAGRWMQRNRTGKK